MPTPLAQLVIALHRKLPNAQFRMRIKHGNIVYCAIEGGTTPVKMTETIQTTCKREALALAHTLPNKFHSKLLIVRR